MNISMPQRTWLMFSAAFALSFAIYLSYEIDRRIPDFGTAEAELAILNPNRTLEFGDKMQAAYNVSTGLPLAESEKWMHKKFDPSEINAIVHQTKLRQLEDAAYLLLRGAIAWLMGTGLVSFLMWFSQRVIQRFWRPSRT